MDTLVLLAVSLRLRPDCPLRPIPELPGDLDRITAQHEFRRLEEDLVRVPADLARDDVDRQLLAAEQSGHAVPDGFSAGVGVYLDGMLAGWNPAPLTCRMGASRGSAQMVPIRNLIRARSCSLVIRESLRNTAQPLASCRSISLPLS
jgi:hypothetical protein